MRLKEVCGWERADRPFLSPIFFSTQLGRISPAQPIHLGCVSREKSYPPMSSIGPPGKDAVDTKKKKSNKIKSSERQYNDKGSLSIQHMMLEQLDMHIPKLTQGGSQT